MLKKNTLFLIILLSMCTFLMSGCANSDTKLTSNNGAAILKVQTKKYITTEYAQKLIKDGYSFSSIAVDPDTKCEYYVSNSILHYDGRLTLSTTWHERKNNNNQIVTYKGNTNTLQN